MRYLYTFLAFVLFIVACEKIVVIDLPLNETAPVVNCLFTPGEPFKVHIGLTTGMVSAGVQVVQDARVELFTEGQRMGMLEHASEGWYTNEEFLPETGLLYTLKVEVPGYVLVTTSDSVPSSFSEFRYLEYLENAWFSDEGTAYDALVFEIDDQTGPGFFEVFYRITTWNYNAIRDSTYISSRMELLRCTDPLIKEEASDFMFSDKSFDGETREIQLVSPNLSFYFNRDSFDLHVQVIQGSPTFYQYRLNYYRHREAHFADFLNPIEPINMFTNVENGYGVFAGFNSKFYPIIFDD